MRSKSGFTLVELMISLVILALISTTTVFALRRTREKDELNTASRLLASDIRNIQARALAARNVLTCEIAPGVKRVCESENKSPMACIGPCAPEPPPRFGISLATALESYTLFADIQADDWRYTGPNELFLSRSLNPLGGSKVVVSLLQTDTGPLAAANIGVGRQNGVMRIEACGDLGLPACSPLEAKILTITLTHTVSGDTITVEVNAVTGRVSIQ